MARPATNESPASTVHGDRDESETDAQHSGRRHGGRDRIRHFANRVGCAPDAAGEAAPIVLAQAAAPMSSAAMPVVAIDPDAGAVNLRGVRKAAAQGPNELRRYIFRTRMIYNFDYEDWAPKP